MQLTRESAKVRWGSLALVWAVMATLVFLHAVTVRDYLGIVGGLGLRGSNVTGTPLQQAFPAFAADAQTWVRHALTLVEGEQVRLRQTLIDNAPAGREVHWNSAWAWTIAAAGWLDHWVTGLPLPNSIERMTVWLCPFTLVALMILISAWVARRAGALAGVVVAIALAGHPRIYEGFFPSYVDHHGLLTMAVVALALGALFMGGGWWKASGPDELTLMPSSPEVARQGAILSGFSGACGMWVSAASVIPPIAIVGVAGVLTLLVWGRSAKASGVVFDGSIWRLWGRVGAGASFGFYLLEYFPQHMGLRLEPNHPFHSLAWWGAGEIIAQVGEWWLRVPRQKKHNRDLGLALAAVAVAPAVILIGGARVFVVVDPFLAQLHRIYIQEFLPLWVTIRGMGWRTFTSVVGLENIPLLAAVGIALVQRRRLPIVLGFACVGGLLVTGMAWLQSRWLLNASGFQVGLTLLVVGHLTNSLRPLLRWTVALVAASVIFMPYAIERINSGRAEVVNRRVSPKDANSALFRDVARVIRASQPEGEIVLLTSPNSSTAVGYYGRFKTLGTLYWENNAGLKAAGTILSARSTEEAAKLIQQHKVTHIAMISEENFVEPYFRLLNPGSKPEDVKRSFGYQLLVDRAIPAWLQMIPYNVPPDLATLNVSALLFKVAFNQTPADALYHIALTKIALGSVAEAEQDFDTLIKAAPLSPQPYFRKGELLYNRGEWMAAAEATLGGIRRSPPETRLNLYAGTASTFFRSRQHAAAAKIYEAALEEGFNPQIASFLAFLLATSSDDSVRNGARAVALAEQALKVDPNSPTTLNSLAVALAETGKFAEAVEMAERALASARALRQADAIRVSEARLAAFRAGKRIRE